LNPDTLVSEDAISGCLAFMDRQKDAGAVGLKMLQVDGVKAPESRRGFPSPFTSFCKFFHLHRLFPNIRLFNRYYLSFLSWNVPSEIDVVSGAFMMIRRAALQKVGLLDEDYFMYGEDIDLSFRLKKAGYTNWYLPFSILHYKGQSTKKTSYRYVHVFYGAMMTFLNKHYHGAYGVLKWPLTAIVGMVALLSLLRLQIQTLGRKVRCFVSSSEELSTYYVLGSEAMQADCRLIMDKYSLKGVFLKPIDGQREPDWASLEDMEIGSKRNRKHTKAVLVVDSSRFTCKQILKLAEKLAGRQFMIAIYWPETHQIITSDEVFHT
ncbi:glycosyltransferase family 2 protein, partial [Prevotella sp.]|uniref:glycosyltransferase family 2 protein n=1 Tax=Prevotella sp. TaxID=59823 RepID=UPI002F928177